MFICLTPLVHYRTIFYVLLLLPIKTPLFITATPPTRMHYNIEYMFSMAPSSKPSLFFVTCTPLHTYRINRGVKSIYCSSIRGFVHCYAACKISVKLILLQPEWLIISMKCFNRFWSLVYRWMLDYSIVCLLYKSINKIINLSIRKNVKGQQCIKVVVTGTWGCVSYDKW